MNVPIIYQCLFITAGALVLCMGTSSESGKLPGRNKCGLQIPSERVFGGQLTEIGEFPWMVLLGYSHSESDGIEFKCGGTLINSRYVLTAAHCLKIKRFRGLSLDIVRLGEWRISTEEDCVEEVVNDECSDPVVDMRIEVQIPHARYSRNTGNNDIALLRLAKDVNYTDYVRPICLPTSDAAVPAVGTSLVVSGWGTTENGSQSDFKLKLEVPVVSISSCADKLSDSAQVTENQICAGGHKGKDTCQGDSGGPLMGTYGEKVFNKFQWYQEGVIARGIGCGREGFPGIYTRVSKYMDWILRNIS